MKKLNAQFITLILLITSCSTESVDSENNPSNILGTWEMVDYDYSGTSVTETQGQKLTTSFTGEAYDLDHRLIFEENPNQVTSEGSFSVKLTYTVLGQTSTQNVENLETVTTGTWEIVDGELITNANNQTGKMKIEKLTESSLILVLEEEQDLSRSGATIITKINAVIYLERQ